MEGKYTPAIVVRLIGLPAHYLRRLERAGLVNPSRTPGWRRLYTERDIEIIREAETLRRHGINLAGITSIILEKFPKIKGVNPE